MSRIGMFGGSFNPVHKGHTGLVERLTDAFSLDLVYVIPTFHTPLKDNAYMVEPEHRYNMCKIAFGNNSKVSVSDIEIKRRGRSYTADTLRELHDRHPQDELFLIVGADSFMQLPQWHAVEEIFSLATVITAIRGDIDYDDLLTRKKLYKDKYNANTDVLDQSIKLVSSTEIRDDIAAGNDVTHLVHKEVLDYIFDNKLYGYEF
ncbi:MAG: nicotinate-nucleotide adenylyltransferase [Ruminococcus sp.]|nr:nicotinate-nucleotide adenylyltransferase [Ruminococcus sp.]